MFTRICSALARRHNVRAHLWQTSANYFTQIIGLGMSVFLARLLTPDDFGQFAYVQALFSLAVALIPCSGGLGQVLISDGGRNPALYYEIQNLIRYFLFVEVGLGAILALYFWLKLEPTNAFLILGIAIFHGINRIVVLRRVDLEARGSFRPIFVFAFFSTLLSGVGTIALAVLGAGVYSLLATPAITALVACWIFISENPKEKRSYHSQGDRVAFHLKAGFWTWLVSLSEVIQTRTDRVIIGSRFSNTDLGYYNRALNFAPLSYLALQSLMNNAATSSYARAKSSDHGIALLTKTSIIVFIGAAMNFAIWYWFSDPLVVWIFGSQWHGAIPCFQAFSALSLALAVVHVPGTFLYAAKEFSFVGGVRLIGAVGFLGSLWLFRDTLTLPTVCYFLLISYSIVGLLYLMRVIVLLTRAKLS